MSLYDDIITRNDLDFDWSSKSSSIKLLQDHLQVRRTTQNLSKNFNRKSSYGVSRISQHNDHELPPMSQVANISANTSGKGTSLLGGDWESNEEYDPRCPNDFEKLVKERNEREKEKKKKENLQVVATRSLGLDYDDEDDDEYEKNRLSSKSKSRANSSIAPPPSLLENVETVSSSNSSASYGGSSVAAKIMAKMGYKEGQGLGKEEQGISKALQVEKTSKTQGIIVHENENKIEELSITEMLKNPSKVILLRNMVGPGEVDEELEPETKEECTKYGEVVKCFIHEYTDYESDEDAVWIFIEFFRVESAIKALIDLNGRYFGGRIVKASFYEREKFRRKFYKT